MVDHMIQRNWHRRVIPCHHIGCGIAHQNDIDACCINDASHRKIIGGQHGDLLTSLLHFLQGVGGDFHRLSCNRHW